MKHLCFLIGLWLVNMTCHAQVFYTLQDGDVIFENGVIEGYLTYEKNIAIPAYIEGQPVTKIASGAFRESNLTSVILPSTLEEIGNNAFSSNLLSSIDIPSSVEVIGNYAFSNNRLTKVSIPNSIKRIKAGVFRNNTLESVTIPKSVTQINGHAFRNNKLTNIKLSNSVVQIGQNAFADNDGLAVNLPAPKTAGAWSSGSAGEELSPSETYNYVADKYTAKDEDFYFSNGTIYDYYGPGGNIVIPEMIGGEEVTEIASFAFRAKGLKPVTLPNTVLSIGESAFAQNNFSRITLPTPAVEGSWNTGTSGSKQDATLAYEYTVSDDASASDFRFEDGVILEYVGSATNVKIPKTIEGQAVTKIGVRAFRGKSLKKVTIPNSVVEIAEQAFESNELSRITIPNSVAILGRSAFAGNNLKRLKLSNAVKVIERRAFSSNDLKSVTIPSSVTDIMDQAFYVNKIKEVTIPSSVKYIGYQAFYANQLTELVLPNSVSYIGNGAFSNNDLTSLVLSTSIAHINRQAFANNELTRVEIPSTVTKIDEQAFLNNDLTGVGLSSSIFYIGGRAFDGNEFSSFILPTPSYKGKWNEKASSGDTISVDDDQDYFYQAKSYKATAIDFRFENGVILEYYGPEGGLVIPKTINGESVVKIGEEAFSRSGLTKLTIPNTVTYIGSSAFEGNSLKKLKIPNSVTYIGAEAFTLCDIEELTLSSSVVYMGEEAFESNALTKLVVPNSVKYIGDEAFERNDLEELTLSNSVTHLGDRSFYGNDLTELSLPNSVTHIGDYAFLFNELPSVTLPSSVTFIGFRAFDENLYDSENWLNLESFVLPTPVADGYVFDGWVTSYGRFIEPGTEEGVYGSYTAVLTEHNAVLVSAKLEGDNIDLTVKGDVETSFTNVSYVDLVVNKGSTITMIADAPEIEGYVYTPSVLKLKNIKESKYRVFSYELIEESAANSRTLVEEDVKTLDIAVISSFAYPNPSTTGQFNIQLSTPAHIKVVTLEGATILEEKVDEIGDLQIDIKQGAGMYFLQVHTAGQVYTQKLQVR